MSDDVDESLAYQVAVHLSLESACLGEDQQKSDSDHGETVIDDSASRELAQPQAAAAAAPAPGPGPGPGPVLDPTECFHDALLDAVVNSLVTCLNLASRSNEDIADAVASMNLAVLKLLSAALVLRERTEDASRLLREEGRGLREERGSLEAAQAAPRQKCMESADRRELADREAAEAEKEEAEAGEATERARRRAEEARRQVSTQRDLAAGGLLVIVAVMAVG